jgi:hypothetical protein
MNLRKTAVYDAEYSAAVRYFGTRNIGAMI